MAFDRFHDACTCGQRDDAGSSLHDSDSDSRSNPATLEILPNGHCAHVETGRFLLRGKNCGVHAMSVVEALPVQVESAGIHGLPTAIVSFSDSLLPTYLFRICANFLFLSSVFVEP